MKKPSPLSSFAIDSLYNFTRQGFVIVIGIVTSAFLTRGLGTTNRGIYVLVILMVNLVINFTNVGLGISARLLCCPR